MREFIHQSDAFLMELHGVLTVGQSVLNAYFKMETVEHFAKIDFIARQLGGARLFSKEQAEELLAARARYGVTTPNIGCRAADGYAYPPEFRDHPGPGANPGPGIPDDRLVEEVTKRVVQALKAKN